jgi:hypothetical protein
MESDLVLIDQFAFHKALALVLNPGQRFLFLVLVDSVPPVSVGSKMPKPQPWISPPYCWPAILRAVRSCHQLELIYLQDGRKTRHLVNPRMVATIAEDRFLGAHDFSSNPLTFFSERLILRVRKTGKKFDSDPLGKRH